MVPFFWWLLEQLGPKIMYRQSMDIPIDGGLAIEIAIRKCGELLLMGRKLNELRSECAFNNSELQGVFGGTYRVYPRFLRPRFLFPRFLRPLFLRPRFLCFPFPLFPVSSVPVSSVPVSSVSLIIILSLCYTYIHNSGANLAKQCHRRRRRTVCWAVIRHSQRNSIWASPTCMPVQNVGSIDQPQLGQTPPTAEEERQIHASLPLAGRK